MIEKIIAALVAHCRRKKQKAPSRERLEVGDLGLDLGLNLGLDTNERYLSLETDLLRTEVRDGRTIRTFQEYNVYVSPEGERKRYFVNEYIKEDGVFIEDERKE